jgi:ParB family chromosome partitioning protein
LKDEVIQKVSINAILPNPYQPTSRIDVDMFTQQKFAESMKIEGMHQTPVCRKKDGKFEMGDGWLRLSGYKYRAGHGEKDCEMIPVIVRELTDQQMADMVFATNTVRKDLNPIELAQFYQKYLEGFKMTQEELGKKHNITQGEVANTLRLLDLPQEIQQKVITQEISPTHGRTLLQLKSPEKMIDLAGKIKDRNWSVADLNGAIKNILRPPAQPPLPSTQPASGKPEKTKLLPAGKGVPLGGNSDVRVDPETGQVLDDEDPLDEEGKGKNPASTSKAAPATGRVPAAEKPLQKVTMEELKASAKLRKVVLEEKSDGVLASVSREGGMPFMKKLGCDLADTPLKLILEEAK